MASYQQHHYVPAFLLRQWHAPPNNKLTQFRWAHNEVRHNRYTAEHVAKIKHLYSALRDAEQPDISLERDYLTPSVDTPASAVHATIVRNGLAGLNSDQAIIWSRFLVAQMIRVPHMVEQMRVRGKEILIANLDAAPEEYEEIRGNAAEETLSSWLQAHAPNIYDDLAVKMMPSIIESNLLNGVILEAKWALLDLTRAKVDLLIGDKPLIQIGSLTKNFLLALPLSPNKLFLAYDQEQTIQNILRQDPTFIVRTVNKETVSKAMQFVYSTNRGHKPLIIKSLRKI